MSAALTCRANLVVLWLGQWGFPLFWIVGLSTSVLLLAIFKLKRWF